MRYNKNMKEILVSVILLMDLYSLYTNPSPFNIMISMIVIISLFVVIVYCMKKKSSKEHFIDDSGNEVSSDDNTDKFIKSTGIIEYSKDKYFDDIQYKETLLTDKKHKNLSDDLVYYVSTFDKTYVDIENSLLYSQVNNAKNGPYPPISFKSQLSDKSKIRFNQNSGLRIIKKLEAPSAKKLLESFSHFTIFWYMKFEFEKKWFNYSNKTDPSIEKRKVYRKCYSGETPQKEINGPYTCLGDIDAITSMKQNKHVYSFFTFDHENIVTVKGNYKLIEIRFIFIPGDYNPTIEIRFVDMLPGGDALTYRYSPDDFYNKKIIFDGNFHLFTFVKVGSKSYFFMDDIPLIDCSGAGGCFQKESIRLYEGDDDILIRDSPMKMNDNIYKPENDGLKFSLNAFGVYSDKIYDDDNTPNSFVTELYRYFKDIKTHMNTFTKFGGFNEKEALTKQLAEAENKLKNLEKQKCPFNNSTICDSQECKYINNWQHLAHIADTPKCFKRVIDYCNDDKNVNREDYCSMFNTYNIGLLARNLEDNEDFKDGLGQNNLSKVGDANCIRNNDSILSINEISLDPHNRKTPPIITNIDAGIERIVKENQDSLDSFDKLDSDKYDQMITEFDKKPNTSTLGKFMEWIF